MEWKVPNTKTRPTGPGIDYKHRLQKSFAANVALLISGIVMSLSGLVLQCHYHLQKNPPESLVMALNRVEWNAVHVWTSIGFLLSAICHVWAHQKWYGHMLKRTSFSTHRPTLLLTVLMLTVAVSGLVPLLICYFDGNSMLRFSLIEIHDKIALLFFVVAVGHAVKRRKWYLNAVKRK